jgi:exopolyphosphatase/guanosine-5'-triphosphate,3'-diphosphate pyrophosphatase
VASPGFIPRHDGDAPLPVAVIDMGASALRLVVSEVLTNGRTRIVEEAQRGVQLGKDTFSQGRLGATTIDSALKALEGFRRIMETYGVAGYRAVATSAVREAQNRDVFLDRVRLRTGLDVEILDGAEENRLTYLAVKERLHDHLSLKSSDALLVEVGGGSADLSFLRNGEPLRSGAYPLGAIRLRQSLASWRGGQEQRVRLLARHIRNVIQDIRREIPLHEARFFLALGGDVRFAAARLAEELPNGTRTVPREPFLAFCDKIAGYDVESLIASEGLAVPEAETLVPALLTYRELLAETSAEHVIVPDTSLRAGLLIDLARTITGCGREEEFGRQVLSSAAALGRKYRYDERHARNVAHLACRLFDELRQEHGLPDRYRILLEVASLLHDIGTFVSLRAHHKHSLYLLSVSEIFGLAQDDMAIVANIARYHRRALPQKTHLPYMTLAREERLAVDKLAAILRLANALDADHLQKVRDVRAYTEGESLILEAEGSGDLTLERLMSLARSDLFGEIFGRKVLFREGGTQT